jgi:hypothetical protein
MNPCRAVDAQSRDVEAQKGGLLCCPVVEDLHHFNEEHDPDTDRDPDTDPH